MKDNGQMDKLSPSIESTKSKNRDSITLSTVKRKKNSPTNQNKIIKSLLIFYI